jgi:hypothetical protein
VADDTLLRLQDVRLPAALHVVLLIVLLLCLDSYPFALFAGECAKCDVVERHVHMEGHLNDPVEPRGRHDIVVQDEARVMAKLLRWPRHDTCCRRRPSSKRTRSSALETLVDDLDLATDVQLLCNNVTWAKGAPVNDTEALPAARTVLFVQRTPRLLSGTPRRRVGHACAHARCLFSSTSRGHTSTPRRCSLHLNLN